MRARLIFAAAATAGAAMLPIVGGAPASAGTVPARTVPARTVPAGTVPTRMVPAGTGEPIAALNAITADGSLAVGADSIAVFLNPLCGTDLSERRGASGFAALKTPSPACGWLNSVVKLPKGRAWAVGNLTTKTAAIETLTEYYNGSRWIIEPSPSPTGGDSLDSVAVSKSGTVWAVGSNSEGSLIYKRTGSTWTPEKTSMQIDLHSITVTPSGQVWAVGDMYNEDLFATGTAIVHLTSKGWRQVPSPNPGESNSSHLDAVASGPHGALWAVGTYYDPKTDLPRGLTLRYTGSSWVQVPIPNPGTQADFLNAVAVGSAGDVWTVGGYTGPRCERNLVEHFTKGSWHVVSVPNRGKCPQGTNALYGVAVSGGKVYAVGEAGIDALAESGKSTGSWKVLKTSN